MERMSNTYLDVLNEVKKELYSFDFRSGQHCAVKYMELPSFPGGQICFCFVEDKLQNSYELIEKTWDSEYDMKRFSAGVYNLDRLCIRARAIQLSREKQAEFQNIIQQIISVPESLERKDYILLDGTEHELQISTDKIEKHYKWKLATEDIVHFERLIEFVKQIA
jgi:hypothetical protein